MTGLRPDGRLLGNECLFCGRVCRGNPEAGEDTSKMDWVYVEHIGGPRIRAHRACFMGRDWVGVWLSYDAAINEIAGAR